MDAACRAHTQKKRTALCAVAHRRVYEEMTLKTEELSVKVTIGPLSIDLGAEAVCSLVDIFEDNESSMEIFAEFAKSPSYRVRAAVASKDNLDSDKVNRLANDSEVEVLRNLMNSRAARTNLGDEQLIGFLEKDAELAALIARNIEYFELANTQKLAELLLNNSDPAIRYQLASNSGTPKSILRKLTKDADPSVVNAAKNSIY